MARQVLAVEGLAEFRRGLRRMNTDLPKALRVAMNESADYLLDKARPLVPRLTGKAVQSLKARSSQQAVRIAVGGRKAPYYPWLDFGGKVGPNGGVRRPFLREGRYLYPTLRKNRDGFERILEKAIVDMAQSAGLEVE